MISIARVPYVEYERGIELLDEDFLDQVKPFAGFNIFP